MFTQKIIDSDAFLEMPLSAQALYFHLNMRADDDGFVNNPKKITKYVNASEDDLKILLLKRFVIGFDSGVIVIKHWRMHNTIKKDRYHATDYIEEFSMLGIKQNKSYTDDPSYPKALPECAQDQEENQSGTKAEPEWNQPGTKAEPQIRLDKNRIEEKKEDANASKKEGGKTAFRAPSIEDVEAYCKSEGFDQTDADDFVNFYEKKGWVVGKTKMKDWKAAVRNWENTERKRRGLPTIGEMRKAAEKKNRETETLVEYPVGSGRMIPEVQARREANRDGAFVEYPTGSGKFIPVYEAEAIRKGKPVNGK